MQPHEVIKQAVNGHAKGVALRMGKSDSYVYKMMAEPEACRYTRFLQFFKALESENPAGANFIREDFIARTTTLEVRAQAEEEVMHEQWLQAVAQSVKESSESIQAAVLERDFARIQKEIAEAIDAHRPGCCA